MEDAIVIAAEVAPGSGVLAGEPVTTATVRDARGRERTVRIVGGPTRSGGRAYLAGYVVPTVGARVALDLRAPEQAPAPRVSRWLPNTPAGVWPAESLPITFVPALPRSRDLGADLFGELEVAARIWSRVPCTSFRARASLEERAVAPGDDGVSAVFVHDDGWPAELLPGAVAQTVVHVDADGVVRDADVHLNGTDFRFSNDGVARHLVGAPGAQDARSVLVHEIGHALGLGHSTDPRATMSASGGGRRWRSLERDDVDGVCALYPGTGSAGCDVDPCPAGFACVAGACQRPGEIAEPCAPCTAEADACEASGDRARCLDVVSGRALVAGEPTAGGVCGRPCDADLDCGEGFACRATTEAGDRQCVSLTACRNGANPCTSSSDCSIAGSVCRDGVCTGLPVTTPPDGGASGDGGPPAFGAPDTAIAARGGCDCDAGAGSRNEAPILLATLAAGVLARRRRR